MMPEQMYVGFWCATYKVLPSKLDWFSSTIEAFWEKWALMDFQCALESDVKVHNCSSLGDLLKILLAEVSEPVK